MMHAPREVLVKCAFSDIFASKDQFGWIGRRKAAFGSGVCRGRTATAASSSCAECCAYLQNPVRQKAEIKRGHKADREGDSQPERNRS